MPPPSRGRWNAGAFAPSAKTGAFSTDELLLREVGEGAGEEDLNRFDAALCDVPADPFLLDVLFGCSLDLLAVFLAVFLAVRLFLVTVVLEAFDDSARCGRLDDVLGDFLGDFLDIRLPFVAFGGSTIRALRTRIGMPDSSRWLGKSDGPGVWLQGFRRTACSLLE